MLKKLSKNTHLMLIFLIASFSIFSRADNSSSPSLPAFNKAAQEIWNQQQLNTEVDDNGEEYNSPCVSLPNTLKPDFKSKTNHTPAWHLDFISHKTKDPEQEKQINKLNVLANAGLLIKSTETVLSNGEKHTVYRFKLSNKGWAADKNSRYPTCFAFGKINYQKAISFDRKIIPNHPDMEIYNVHATIGIRSLAEMPDWAQKEDVQSEFPIIKESLAGKNFPTIIIKENGKWVDGALALMKTMFENSPEALKQIENDAAKREMRAKNRKTPDNLTSNLPAATPKEIKAILEAAYRLNSDQSNPSNCLSLPGDNNLPVDKNLSTHQPKHYAIEISTSKTRNDKDPILTKTIPYISHLERIGVLQKAKSKSPEENSPDIYELNDKYGDKIDPQYLYCFPLGKPTIEIVDLKIKDIYSGRFLKSSVRYKFKIMNNNPPAWLKNNEKLKEWPELQDFLNFGRACEGNFIFDRKTREMAGGSGACIKSFDSIVGL